MSRTRFAVQLFLSTLIVVFGSLAMCDLSFIGAVPASGSTDEPQSIASRFFNAMSPEEFCDPDALDNFIFRFPEAPEARWAFAFRYSLLESAPTIDGYNQFIGTYPDRLQSQFALNEVFKMYRSEDRVAGYLDFIQRYPDTQQALVARLHLHSLMFDFVCTLNQEEEYNDFLRTFPDAVQYEQVLAKAQDVSIKTEKDDFEAFKKSEPQPTEDDIQKRVNRKIAEWEKDVDDTLREVDKAQQGGVQEEIEKSNLDLVIIVRSGETLREVYPEYDNNGRISRKFDTLSILGKMETIKKTLNKNHQELVKVLKEESDRICNQLEEGFKLIHKDNVELQKQLSVSFGDLKKALNTLHDDLVIIHEDLQKLDVSLENINTQLKKIDKSITEGFEKTNANLNRNFEKLGGKIDSLTQSVRQGFAQQAQISRTIASSLGRIEGNQQTQIALSRQTLATTQIMARTQLATLAGIRQANNQLSNLNNIAKSGFERVSNVWQSTQAQLAQQQMMERVHRTTSRPSLGRRLFAGVLGFAAGAATTLIPTVGPMLAPIVAGVVNRGVMGESTKDIAVGALADTAKVAVPYGLGVMKNLASDENSTVMNDGAQKLFDALAPGNNECLNNYLSYSWTERKASIIQAAARLIQDASGISEENIDAIEKSENEAQLQNAICCIESANNLTAGLIIKTAEHIL